MIPQSFGIHGVRLGQAVNLLHGTDPIPFAPDSLCRAGKAALLEFPIEFDDLEGSGWQPLRVTVHQDLESLADRLGGVSVERLRFDLPEFEICPARLLRSEEDRLVRHSMLQELLGIELVEGRTYLLLERRRVDGLAQHEVTARLPRAYFNRVRHLPGWRQAVSQLRPGTRIHEGYHYDAHITPQQAQLYIDYFYEFGTHFISSVEAGEVLVQLVALRPEACALVLTPGAELRNYVEAPYASETGPILSLAARSQVPAKVGTSLVRSEGEVLRAFQASATIRLELTSIARFLEYFRAINFERVLRGAMFQRWGDRVRLPLRRLPTVERTIAETSSSAGSAICRRVLSVRSSQQCPPGGLLAQFLDAEPLTNNAATIQLSDEEFEIPPIVCQTMVGALILADNSGSRRDVIVDGLRFMDTPPEPDSDWRRVGLRGDLHSLAPAHLPAALPSIRAALTACGADLGRAGAASFAEWLATVLPVGTHARLRTLALYLSRVEARIPLGQPALNLGDCAGIHRHFQAIASSAIEADFELRDVQAEGWAEHKLARLRAFRQRCSEHYCSLLAEIETDASQALQSAIDAHAKSAQILLDAVQHAPQSLVMDAVRAAARSQQPQLLRRQSSDDEVTSTAIEWIGLEAQLHRQAAQIGTLEELCRLLAAEPTAFDCAECILERLDLAQTELDSNSTLGLTLPPEWEPFHAARAVLNAARGNLCRIRMEPWYNAVLEADNAADVRGEHFRLLTIVGQALRRQQAMLGAQSHTPAELGAKGHLIARQNRYFVLSQRNCA